MIIQMKLFSWRAIGHLTVPLTNTAWFCCLWLRNAYELSTCIRGRRMASEAVDPGSSPDIRTRSENDLRA